MADKLELSVETLTNLSAEVSELDKAISAASGSGANAKKAIRERIAGEVSSDVDGIITKLSSSFEQVDDRVLVGVLARIQEDLIKNLKERENAFVETEQKAAVPEGASDNVKAMREQRKEIVDRFKAVHTLLDAAGADLSGVEMPTARRGGGGGAGRKAKKGKFVYSIDNKPLSDTQQSFSSMAWYALGGKNAETEGLGPSKYLRKLLEEAGIDPKGEFEYKLTVGDTTKTITAVARAEATEAEVEAASE